jgi:hypothetical protein
MERFKYLGSMLTNEGRCTCEIKSRIAMAKAAFVKKKNLFTSTLDLNLRKKLIKCYIWSVALYGAEGEVRNKVSFLPLLGFEPRFPDRPARTLVPQTRQLCHT